MIRFVSGLGLSVVAAQPGNNNTNSLRPFPLPLIRLHSINIHLNMSMLGGFSASKLKPRLKMATNRFQIAIAKKSAIMKQQKREIALMLAEEPIPKEEKARIRAEALIRDDNTVEAYEILQLECELLYERMTLIKHTKECPSDLVSCVSTLMWASQIVDINELQDIRKQFRAKYGKKFDEAAMANEGGILNERVVAKLSIHPPTAILVRVSTDY